MFKSDKPTPPGVIRFSKDGPFPCDGNPGIVLPSSLVYGLVMAVNASFNGSGRPLPGVMISATRVIFLFLPLAFAGRWLFGLNGLFAASALAHLGVGIMAYAWLGKHVRSSEQTSINTAQKVGP